jgi:hypothetical protein
MGGIEDEGGGDVGCDAHLRHRVIGTAGDDHLPLLMLKDSEERLLRCRSRADGQREEG